MQKNEHEKTMNNSDIELQHNHTFLWSSLDTTNYTNINGSGYYGDAYDLENPSNTLSNRLTLRYGIVSTVILMYW